MFREDKATAAACYFLQQAPNHRLNDLKLMKLLYLAERESLRLFTSTITGSTFASLKNGPVLREVLDLFAGRRRSKLWHKHIEFLPLMSPGVTENTLSLTHSLDSAEHLSAAELSILSELWAKHKGDHKWEMVDITHEFPEWNRQAREANTSYPLPLERIFELGFKEGKEAAATKADEIAYYQELLG